MKRIMMILIVLLGPTISAVQEASAAAPTSASGHAAAVERGRYLVNGAGCGDCHTPLKMGANGPEPDMERMLSGHPDYLGMPEVPTLPPGPWMVVSSATNTAWAGPWGVSFTANITSDPETGIGKWTEDEFVGAIRSGRHMGRGRPILPPMPVPAIQNLTDEDLASIYAYLMTVPPIRNQVPQPRPPMAN
jgi:mono/diheme cytochrome c family protein